MTNHEQKYLYTTKKIVLNHVDRDNYAVFLYGSRANGKSWKYSDVDVGVLGNDSLPIGKLLNIIDDIEEADIPYKVDVVDFFSKEEEFKKFALSRIELWNLPYKLKNVIAETNNFVYEPKELYGRRVGNFRKALVDFKKSMDIDLSLFSKESVVDTLKNGQIQKFEICAELMWKTIKRFLEFKENIKVKSPNSAMSQFYEKGYIDEKQYGELIQLWEDRNFLSHEYSESYFEKAHSHLPEHLKSMTKVLKIIEN